MPEQVERQAGRGVGVPFPARLPELREFLRRMEDWTLDRIKRAVAEGVRIEEKETAA